MLVLMINNQIFEHININEIIYEKNNELMFKLFLIK